MDTIHKPQDDLQAIRNMMERSSKFLSLSGLSGIFAGCFALAGACIAGYILTDSGNSSFINLNNNLLTEQVHKIKMNLITTAVVVLILALGVAILFSARKARKKNLHFWDRTTKTMIYHLLIPLFTGGILSIILITHNNWDIIPAITLLFYGLALVNAGKFTFGEIHYLGLFEIALGLIAAVFMKYSLIFWTIGFGILHILYGIIMYRKYEK